MTFDDGATATAVGDGEGAWAPLQNDDVVAFLGMSADEREDAAGRALAERVRVTDPAPLLPFAPASFRAFSVFEQHMIDSGRALAKSFLSPAAGGVIDTYEKATRGTFPKLKPAKLAKKHPLYYLGNHRAFITEGETVEWPHYCDWLDYELELGFVLSRPVKDANAEQALEAIGGFFVVNDWSARDTQWEEYRDGIFGPVIKAKGFANSMSAEVVTADEILPHASALTGTVHVNGEAKGSSSSAGMSHSFADMVAYASRGEQLRPGDMLATGTFAGCCGLERMEKLAPGDRVELEIDRVGRLENTVGVKPAH
ncbi:MAG: fumarylacetoacetate hydrolase family protein [Thermoleophilaceae bacterium]|nr:fumarylacetoacetate hydrolase family protein [Thermoleophilaceae bacterium]